MFDCKVIVILIFGIVLMELFQYNQRITKSRKIMYYLLPIALVLIILYETFHEKFMCETNKKILRWMTVILFIVGIYIYLHTRKEYYPHLVYQTSIHVIWAIIIVFFIVYLGDPLIFDKIGIFKLILFTGLMLSLIKF
ncbi:putative orfan [Tupanvirus soda lake]|uniref:Orfan n=2 Tax=Tupanvirus TaxID=2094720 RepID=A0AC62ACQ6_9VIRU|nr:putative orfan [Tupanvirus soda lake]QKU35463.1 putative orfan [Tupanvirus soda lake]